MDEERRQHARHPAWFPLTLHVEGSGEEAFAITFDVSSSGLLVACPGRVEVGVEVSIQIHPLAEADESPEPRRVKGKVIRVTEAQGEQRQGPWRYQMAIQLDEPAPWIEELVATAPERA